MKIVKITTPLTDGDVEKLRAGQKVLLSGKLYTARDATHKKIIDRLKENGSFLPDFSLKNQVLFYVGPTPPRPGESLGVYGPTTSKRMDGFLREILEQGVKGTIGKGCRTPEAIKLFREYRAVYFVAIGGISAYLSRFIKNSKVLAFPELGPEAFSELTVEDFPLFVGNDIYGGDIYSDLRLTLEEKFHYC